MSIKNNLNQILKQVSPYNCQLIAVSKNHPADRILEAYTAGQREFGENKVQELTEKYQQLPKDIHWHMIGHLQTNKVKYIAPFIHLIHSVDSFKLLKEINKEALKNNRIIDTMLQIHIAKEETKFGFSFEEAETVLKSEELQSLKNIQITGLMGMATNSCEESVLKEEFGSLKKKFDQWKEQFKSPNISLKHVSMGMSGDYLVALKEGSTMIRVGSSIFGVRNYN